VDVNREAGIDILGQDYEALSDFRPENFRELGPESKGAPGRPSKMPFEPLSYRLLGNSKELQPSSHHIDLHLYRSRATPGRRRVRGINESF
jgi:hypothetical protein